MPVIMAVLFQEICGHLLEQKRVKFKIGFPHIQTNTLAQHRIDGILAICGISRKYSSTRIPK
jgi:hypothetical protein